jgi:ribosomal protein L12E/L44/L45/RPP1/RPP2
MQTTFLTPKNAARLVQLAELKGKNINELLEEIFQDFKTKPTNAGVSIHTAQEFHEKTRKEINEVLPQAVHIAKQEAASNKANYDKQLHTIHEVVNIVNNVVKQLKDNDLTYDN